MQISQQPETRLSETIGKHVVPPFEEHRIVPEEAL
jgi:hypothetical protein